MAFERSDVCKIAIADEGRKTEIMKAIIDLVDASESLLLLGHEHPDEDCISSMVAFGLIAGKMHKRVCIYLPGTVQESFDYLLAISRYNSIDIVGSTGDIPPDVDVIVVLDTPKPSMLEGRTMLLPFFTKDRTVVEIDHHLASDARYIGDENYSLVDAASSSCELIGLLTIELEKRSDLLEKYQISELFTRNLVLSLITGIISDSRMGKYLKSEQERWFYNWISQLFDRMLAQKTHSGSGNLATKEEVFSAISALSSNEERCYRKFLEKFQSYQYVDFAILDERESSKMYEEFGSDIFVSVAKTIADTLAEKSLHLGLVAYYDHSSQTDLVQFRLRRSHLFQRLDLREFLVRHDIANGGGHPGAIGFRFKKSDIGDIRIFTRTIVENVAAMVQEIIDAENRRTQA